MLCHKAAIRKCKKIEILPCVLSDHNGLRIEINDIVKKGNYSNTCRLNNTLLNETWITKNIREEIKKFLEVPSSPAPSGGKHLSRLASRGRLPSESLSTQSQPQVPKPVEILDTQAASGTRAGQPETSPGSLAPLQLQAFSTG